MGKGYGESGVEKGEVHNEKSQRFDGRVSGMRMGEVGRKGGKLHLSARRQKWLRSESL